MEIQILHWFESLHNPITDPIMYFITTLGNGGIFWIILAAAMLIILPKRYKKVGLSMAIAPYSFTHLLQWYYEAYVGKASCVLG